MEPQRVLFVCTGNSARSQLAEALLGRAGTGRFVATSAGTEPAGVNPLTIRVLDEVGIDWSAARSKKVSDVMGEHYDVVVTVCDRARQTCPYIPGAYRRLHWDLEDPAAVEGSDEERLAAFRQTRDQIAQLVAGFVAGEPSPDAVGA